MQYFQLDKVKRVSRFCFGCEALGGSDWGEDVDTKKIAASIEQAIDAGVNFFDTADVYGLGLSESRLAKILSHKRHDLIIATKGGVSWEKTNKSARAKTTVNSSPSYIRTAVENSLKRLKLDYIPVYYIHWPELGKDIGYTVEALHDLQNEGKIGSIGCSNFTSEQLLRSLEFAPISLLQIPVNILSNYPSPEILDICKNNNIRIVGYNVLASGLLTGKYNINSTFPESDRRSRLPQFRGDELKKSLNIIEDLNVKSRAEGLSLTQYSIEMALNTLSLDAAIIGIKTTSQFDENISSFK